MIFLNQNCTHNTRGDHCENCLPGYAGDAHTGHCYLPDQPDQVIVSEHENDVEHVTQIFTENPENESENDVEPIKEIDNETSTNANDNDNEISTTEKDIENFIEQRKLRQYNDVKKCNYILN